MLNEYIDTKYITKDEIICKYYIEPNKVKIERAANHLAGESSIDTWSDIKTLEPETAKKLKPHVFHIDKKNRIIKVAYSTKLFETNSIPQILSSIAGNIFSMKLIKNLRLLDVSFPKEVVYKFKGPEFGIDKIRKLLKVKNRPLVGTIVKPKVGLTTKKHSEVAYKSWVGGCDLVKDDENLTNQKFNKFTERVRKTLKMRNKAEKETGERKMYIPNITSPTCQEMIKRAEFVKKEGGEYVMIDIIPTGWTALQTLREANKDLKLVIHAHRCMHSVMTKNKKHGITMMVIAKLTRLTGIDQLHIGTVIGKMRGDKKEVMSVRKICISKEIKKDSNLLDQDWYNIKKVFPVASGGLHAKMIPQLIKMFGKDIILQFGGGIHAHPLGSEYGARECREMIEKTI